MENSKNKIAISYKQLFQQINNAANHLKKLNIKSMDKIYISSEDSLNFIVTFLGAIKVGIIPIPGNPELNLIQKKQIIDNSKPKLIISDDEIMFNKFQHIKTKKWLDIFALFTASIIATFFARYAIKTNFMSEMLNDRTQGQDQIPEAIVYILEMFITSPTNWISMWSNYEGRWIFTPVWIPQLPMSIGTILLAICLWDHLSRLLITNKSEIKSDIVK